MLPLLGDLEPAELELVRQREASGRAHPWILARVDALLEAEADADTALRARLGAGPDGRRASRAGCSTSRRRHRRGRAGRRRLGVAPRLRLGGRPTSRSTPGPTTTTSRSCGTSPSTATTTSGSPRSCPLLANLGAEDLKMVREEEAAGKARASILARIDGLLARDVRSARRGPGQAAGGQEAPSKAAANLPIEDYDNLNVAQIQARLIEPQPGRAPPGPGPTRSATRTGPASSPGSKGP